jgi:NADPH-dependent glutamate synthase beta subunit-like oxidoreductase
VPFSSKVLNKEREAVVTREVLIIGGSTAGLQAALDLADADVWVYLIEATPFLSGLGRADRPRHIINTRLLDVSRHPNISVWTNTLLTSAEVEKKGIHVELRRQPRYVDIAKCTACGDCVKVCPVVVSDTNHKAIYLEGQPGCMAIDKEGKPPCANTCPGGIHVQGYVALIAQGRFQEAIDLVRQAIPFPGICGRVCTHPCEVNCRRAEVDKPVAIRLLKRFVSEWELSHGKKRKIVRPASLTKKVAVVGAGPGGMAVADHLACLGYPVTVFEKLPVIGGMMAVGIPEYRLPRKVIAREYKQIRDLGVDVQLNTAIGPGGKYTLDELFEQGFSVVCLAVGAHRSLNLNIPGEDLPGVVHGIELLRAINLSQRVKDPQYKAKIQQVLRRGEKTRVAVLGGGNTAMDASRSLRRLGVKNVRILYRRTRAEMPAMPEEVEEAEQEGVVIDYLVSPVRVLGNEKRGVTGLECIRMKLGEPDSSGRRRPVPIAGSEFVVNLDVVVLAIGQAPDFSFLGQEDGIAITRNERINVADVSFMTSRPGVFAVGDAVTNDKMVVIEAIGMGKKAAVAIDAYLRGQLPKEFVVNAREIPIARRELDKTQLPVVPRIPVPTIPLEQRQNSFAEMELGYNAQQAMAEAQRCLVCGPCSECQACVQVCKTGAIVHSQHETYAEIDVGAILYAGDPEKFPLGEKTETPGLYRIQPEDALAASAIAGQILGGLTGEQHFRIPFTHPITDHVPERIGLFVCQCGDEIASVVDIGAVCEQLSEIPGIVHSQVLAFSCSPDAAEAIRQAILSHRLDGAVLAACSCCTQDQVCYSCTYQRVRCKGNLGIIPFPSGNLSQSVPIEFINIREQCAWVHFGDPQAATDKAIVLLKAAVAGMQVGNGRSINPPVIENGALILGSGEAASVCKKFLDRQKIPAQRLRGLPVQVTRAGGQYIAVKNGQKIQSPALVLAPQDPQEMRRLLMAFERADLIPRVDTTWGGVETHRPGVFFCDPAVGADMAGLAAAARVASWLGRVGRRIPSSAMVNTARCRACSTCVNICEFGAPTLMVVEKNRISSWIDPVICTGCGTCVARCPSGAITPGTMSDEALRVMLGAILNGGGTQNGGT